MDSLPFFSSFFLNPFPYRPSTLIFTGGLGEFAPYHNQNECARTVGLLSLIPPQQEGGFPWLDRTQPVSEFLSEYRRPARAKARVGLTDGWHFSHV